MLNLWKAPLEQPWSNLVAKYSVFVARHPWPFIILPTLLTAVLSMGIVLDFEIVRGVRYLYSSVDAEWKAEEAVLINNWASDDKHFYPGKDVTRRRGLYLIISAKDGGNILRKTHSKEVLEVLEWVVTANFSTPTGEQFSYRNVCLQFQNECFTNRHAQLVSEVFSNSHQSSFNITYPTYKTKFATEPIDLSKALGNVTADSKGFLVSASAWSLLYQLKSHEEGMNELSSNFENAVASAIESARFPSKLLHVVYFHSDTFEQELARENKRITPMFSVTFTVLIIFSILCTFTIRWVSLPINFNGTGIFKAGKTVPVIDWVLSKPWMGVVGVVSTLMAIISSTGLLLLFGVTFVDMCTVMPFLSLTIGIDDTFLMLAAWHDTDRSLPMEARIEKSMRHAAVSISITSLTDALAFLIGAIAPLPAVMYFCYYSSAAICFIFLYCMTVFIACLSLQARWEDKRRNCITGKETHDIADLEKVCTSTLLFGLGSRVNSNETITNNNDEVFKSTYELENKKFPTDNRMWYQRFFEDHYTPFISQKWCCGFSLLLLIGYIVTAYLGTQRLVVGFDLMNIVQQSSLSRRFLETRVVMFPEDLSHLDIAVLRPPNMANAGERNKFLHALEQFESTFCSAGRNTTSFWYFDYQKYMDDLGFGTAWDTMNEDGQSFSSNRRSFLLSNEKWDYDVLSNGTEFTRAFRLSTRIRNVSDDRKAFDCARKMRSLCREYSDYAISTYTPLWNIADQYDIMWPQTMQDLYISIAVMIPVSLLFIPQPLCAFAIGLNIASIALGVIGFMAWWSVNLDATSMITIAMSVGFSVDFAAHVSYAYMTEEGDEVPGECPARTRLRRTLGSVGWPVAQASLSVLLGVSSLSSVDSYVVQTCFKTVVLVITFGTVHALLFLPLVLMYVHKIYLYIGRKSSAKKIGSV